MLKRCFLWWHQIWIKLINNRWASMGDGALRLVEQGSDLQSGTSYPRHCHTDSISGILINLLLIKIGGWRREKLSIKPVKWPCCRPTSKWTKGNQEVLPAKHRVGGPSHSKGQPLMSIILILTLAKFHLATCNNLNTHSRATCNNLNTHSRVHLCTAVYSSAAGTELWNWVQVTSMNYPTYIII